MFTYNPSLQQRVQTIFALPSSLEQLINESGKAQLQQNAGLTELATKIDGESIIIDFTVGSFQLIR